MTAGVSLADLGHFLPELILGATVVSLCLADTLMDAQSPRKKPLGLLAIGGVFVAFLACLDSSGEMASAFYGKIAIDPLGSFFKLVFLAITAITILTSALSKELPERNFGEYYTLLLAVTFGMFLMAGSNDLLIAYLGIEMVSIVSFAMVGFRLRNKRSSEAALKYVVYGGAASGIMLFGISLLYGLFGYTDFTEIHHALNAWGVQYFEQGLATGGSPFPITLLLAVTFIFAGIGYKIAVVPFHMWSPDVYEGAPTPFTAFLSVGPKAAGFAMLIRIFIGVFIPEGEGTGFSAENGIMDFPFDLPIPALLGCIAAATMTFGNLAAIPQTNVKRLLAYSSIAHAGYLLMGFVVLSESALQAVIIYVVFYYFMNVGAFTVCQAVRDLTGSEEIADYAGLGTRAPLLAVFMTVFLVSLTGLPPVAGFIAKFYLFYAVIEHGGYWFWALAVLAAINSAISLFYYFNIVKAMWLRSAEDETPLQVSPIYSLICAAMAIPTLIFGLYWTPVSEPAKEAISIYRSPKPAGIAEAPLKPQEPTVQIAESK